MSLGRHMPFSRRKEGTEIVITYDFFVVLKTTQSARQKITKKENSEFAANNIVYHVETPKEVRHYTIARYCMKYSNGHGLS